jgi:hypothetical protein
MTLKRIKQSMRSHAAILTEPFLILFRGFFVNSFDFNISKGVIATKEQLGQQASIAPQPGHF